MPRHDRLVDDVLIFGRRCSLAEGRGRQGDFPDEVIVRRGRVRGSVVPPEPQDRRGVGPLAFARTFLRNEPLAPAVKIRTAVPVPSLAVLAVVMSPHPICGVRVKIGAVLAGISPSTPGRTGRNCQQQPEARSRSGSAGRADVASAGEVDAHVRIVGDRAAARDVRHREDVIGARVRDGPGDVEKRVIRWSRLVDHRDQPLDGGGGVVPSRQDARKRGTIVRRLGDVESSRGARVALSNRSLPEVGSPLVAVLNL